MDAKSIEGSDLWSSKDLFKKLENTEIDIQTWFSCNQ